MEGASDLLAGAEDAATFTFLWLQVVTVGLLVFKLIWDVDQERVIALLNNEFLNLGVVWVVDIRLDVVDHFVKTARLVIILNHSTVKQLCVALELLEIVV